MKHHLEANQQYTSLISSSVISKALKAVFSFKTKKKSCELKAMGITHVVVLDYFTKS